MTLFQSHELLTIVQWELWFVFTL